MCPIDFEGQYDLWHNHGCVNFGAQACESHEMGTKIEIQDCLCGL